MKIVGYHKHGRRIEKTVKRFLKPAKKYGHSTELYEITPEMIESGHTEVPYADLYVVCGWYVSRDLLLNPRLIKDNVLIISDCSIRPLDYKVTKYNQRYGPNVYLTISNMLNCVGSKYVKLPSNRWKAVKKAHRIHISPWKLNGNIVLVTYASDGIYLNHDRNTQAFVNCIKVCIKRGFKVVVCSHPNEVNTDNPYGDASKMDEFKNLGCKFDVGADKYLNKAICVICYAGTMGFKSTILGIPVFPVLPCFVSNLYEDYDMTDINKFLDKIPHPNRDKWFNWLAHQQWMYKEVDKGLVWKFMVEDKNMEFKEDINKNSGDRLC